MDEHMEEETSQRLHPEKWVDNIDNCRVESALMKKMVMDYLVAEGFKEAAEKFEEEAGISPGVNLDTLNSRILVRDAILAGSMDDAVSLINNLHPDLLDENRVLLFHLQLQHVIELIRNRQTEEALNFAQMRLPEHGEDNPECLKFMESALALLAYDKPEESPFGYMLQSSQRHEVWSRVNRAIVEREKNLTTPRLASIVKLLMWSQGQLDKKSVKYPKMTDIAKGEISQG